MKTDALSVMISTHCKSPTLKSNPNQSQLFRCLENFPNLLQSPGNILRNNATAI